MGEQRASTSRTKRLPENRITEKPTGRDMNSPNKKLNGGEKGENGLHRGQGLGARVRTTRDNHDELRHTKGKYKLEASPQHKTRGKENLNGNRSSGTGRQKSRKVKKGCGNGRSQGSRKEGTVGEKK